MFYTVYKVTNKLDGKYYIGKHKTVDLDDGYMGSGKLIKRAIEEHGIENFVKEILHVFETEEEMDAKEAELVVVSEETYNLCPGGKGGWGYVNAAGLNCYETHSDVARKTIEKARVAFRSKMQSNVEFNALYCATMSRRMKDNPTLGFLGKKHNDATKKLIGEKNSKTQRGSKNSQYGTHWITNGIEETKTRGFLPKGWRFGRK